MTTSPAPAGVPAAAIPGPRPRPVIGNALDIDRKHAVESAIKLAREYGPIYRLVVPGAGPRYVVSGASLVEELCDEKRFDKPVTGGLSAVRRDPVSTGLLRPTPATRCGCGHTTSCCRTSASRPCATTTR